MEAVGGNPFLRYPGLSMFMSRRLSGMPRLTGGIEVNSFYIVGELDAGLHKLPARRYILFGMFFLFQGLGISLPNPFGYCIGYVLHQMIG